ncbi:hypothetical protein EDB85DRAFT_735743 [Lactarius pseudohatsudake]|nr:hypothetical protein EDB85DRAFT_735743 [Lactarius pseudohatsudake]
MLESPQELVRCLRELTDQYTTVLFMDCSPEVPHCGFEREISYLLREKDAEFRTLTSSSTNLNNLNNLRTCYPRLIVKGGLVGGLDTVQEMTDNSEVRKLIVST